MDWIRDVGEADLRRAIKVLACTNKMSGLAPLGFLLSWITTKMSGLRPWAIFYV